MSDIVFERAKSLRRKPYSLEQFRAKYGGDSSCRRSVQTIWTFVRRTGSPDGSQRRKPAFEAIAADIIL